MKDLGFFLSLWRQRRGTMVLGAFLALITLLAMIALLGLSGWFIAACALSVLAPSGQIFNFLLPSAGIRALAVVRTLGRYGERVISHDATLRILADLRGWFFRQAIPLAPAGLLVHRKGDLLARITADIDALDHLYLQILVPPVIAVLAVTGATLFLWLFLPAVALSTLALLAVAGVLLPYLIQRAAHVNARALTVRAATLRIDLLDLIEGLATLRAYDGGGAQIARIQKASDALIRAQTRLARLSATGEAVMVLLLGAAVVAALTLGIPFLQAGGFDGASFPGARLALIVFCVIAVFEAVAPLPNAFQSLGQTLEAAKRLRQIAAQTPPVIFPAPNQSAAPPGDMTISFQAVTFGYETARGPVLKDLSLTVEPGRTVAIRGASGAGKSSLLALLQRHHDPQEGTIEIGGLPLNHLGEEDLAALVGIMDQSPQLLSGSIKENMALARPEASEAEMIAALAQAGLGDLIEQLGDGLESWVGDHGLRLSGGEARRLTIARLILQDPPIWLLDEPTEGLDLATEAKLLETLAPLLARKTVFLISHRPGPLGLADQSYHLEEGQLFPVTASPLPTEYLPQDYPLQD
ncbi:MAG: thiol reductant ABC exporter subunit CydC [Pseudomonadota bacterium]